MSRGLRELSLIAMGPGATDNGALASAVPVPELRESVDSRMEWIFRHQAAVPESQGDILPEYIASLTDYRA